MRARKERTVLGWLVVAVCCAAHPATGAAQPPPEAAPPETGVPPVGQWPSPNPELTFVERNTRIAIELERNPALIDEIVLANGAVEPVTIVGEDEATLEVLRRVNGRTLRVRIPHTEVAELRRATPEVALERRLAHVVAVERLVDGRATVPAEPGDASPVALSDRGGISPDGVVAWDFERLEALADLPGVVDFRWWPAQESGAAASVYEPEDTVLNRRGIWALITEQYGHGRTVGLQVTVNASRMTFEHSPGFWGAPLERLHGHWRLYVDDVLRWEYFADVSAEAPDGRYPYGTTSITMGPGTHVVRWELEGCDLHATYFWGIDRLTWYGVAAPEMPPAWGPLEETPAGG